MQMLIQSKETSSSRYVHWMCVGVWCICMWHMHVSVQVCVHAHKYGNQKRMPGVCLYYCLTCCLETGSPTKPEVPQFSKAATQQIHE